MDIIGLLTVVILVALALYVIEMLIADAMLKNVLRVVIIVFLVLWILRAVLPGIIIR